MRKSLFLSLTLGGLLFGAFGFHSCQKETKETVVSTQKKKEPHVQTKSCVGVTFSNKQVDVACAQGYGCDQFISIPTYSQNRIQWRLDDCSYSPYTNTAYYAVYKRTGTSGSYPSYTKIASFQCNKSNMWYANPVLTNNSDFVILVTEVATTTFPTIIIEEYDTISNSYFYYDTFYANPLSFRDFWRFSTGSTAGSTRCVNIGKDK